MRSAVPLLDHFLSEGPRPALGKTVRNISSLTGADIVTVLRHAWSRYKRSGGAHAPRYNKLGLGRELLARVEAQDFSHPWLLAPTNALPGKTVHVAFLMRAQKSLELYPRRSAPPHIAPLLSQPIVELCRSEEHTSELQSLMRISYAVFCLKKKKKTQKKNNKTL